MKYTYEEMNNEVISMMLKESKRRMFAEGILVHDVYVEIINDLIPHIGFWMAEHDVDQISEEKLRKILEKHMEERKYYWLAESCALKQRAAILTAYDMGVEKIQNMLVEDIKLLSMVEDGKYQFFKTEFCDYFAGLCIHKKLREASNMLIKMKKYQDEDRKAALAKEVVEVLSFFEKRLWSSRVLNVCAGEFYIQDSLPYQIAEGWGGWNGLDNEIMRVMELFRREPENLVMKMILDNREQAGEGKSFYLEKNLIEMLRQGRMTDDYVDFSGIDFHGIDLTNVDLCDVVFCHKYRGEIWSANLEHTGMDKKEMLVPLRGKTQK